MLRRAQLAEDMDELDQHVSVGPRNSEQVRQLADDDVDRDAGEKSGGDGDRKQRREPAGTQQADGCERDADEDGQQRRELGIMRGADIGDRRQRAGEDRRDGRIRRNRHVAVGAERCEGERAGGEGVEAGLGRHSGEPRGRELPGYRDRRQHQPGDEITRQPLKTISPQRREQPGRHPTSATPPARRAWRGAFVLLRVAHRGVILAADVRDIDLRRRQLQSHVLHGVGDDLRHREIAEPFVVGRDDEPRRVLGARQRHGILVGRDVFRPQLALGIVALADLPVPRRIVEPLREARELLLAG